MTRFGLPILKPAEVVTIEQIVRLTLHADEQYELQLGDAVGFEFGLGIMGSDLPGIDWANQVRDIAPLAEWDGPRIVEAVEQAYGARQLRCLEVGFAGGMGDPGVVRAFEQRRYQRVSGDIWRMGTPRFDAVRNDLSVIPARASFAKVAELWRAYPTQDSLREQYADLGQRYLDETMVDGLLALDGTEPAGTLNLVTFGELGLVADLFVHPRHQGKKVGQTLLWHAVELAARCQVKHLTLLCRRDNIAAARLYEKTGFVKIAPMEHLRWVG